MHRALGGHRKGICGHGNKMRSSDLERTQDKGHHLCEIISRMPRGYFMCLDWGETILRVNRKFLSHLSFADETACWGGLQKIVRELHSEVLVVR